MTTENLLIRINERGALQVSRNIKGIGAASKTAATGTQLLGRALGALAVADVARRLVGLNDAYTNIQNRLRLVTSGTEDLNRVQQELLDISQRTRSDLGSNVELFNRITLATKDLGTEQSEVLNFTESLNQAIKISGATAQEAEAGIIQLSQGLASGALRGDELRSVLEQLPAVADVIAKELDVTRGQLRELGKDGKITAEVVLAGFRNAREELAERFQTTVGTTAEEFVKLKNVVTIAVGEFFNATGAAEGLAGVLNSITTFIAESIPLFTSFGRAISNTLTPQDELTAGLQLFASGIVIVQSLLTSLVSVLQNTVGVVFTAVGERIGATAAALVQFAQGNVDEAASIIEDVNQRNADQIVQGAQNLNDILVGETTDTIETLVNIWDEGARLTAEARQRVFEFDTDGGDAPTAPTLLAPGQQDAIDAQAKFLEGLGKESAALQLSIETGRSYEQALQDIQIQQLAATTGIEGFADSAQALVDVIEAQRNELELRNLAAQDQQFLVSLQAEAELIGLSNRERFIETQLRNLSAEATDQQRQAVEELAGALFDENEALKKAAFTFEEFQKSLSRGVFDSLSGALAGALTDGLDDIPAQFSQLLLDLTSKLLASKLLELLANFGQSQGGTIGNLIGAFAGGFANGGSFMVGGSGGTDSQLVSLAATPGERVTVETPQQQRASAPPVVNVGAPTIVNTIDPDEVVAAGLGNNGDVILNFATENKTAFRNALGIRA